MNIGIYGLGLMGGSLAYDLKKKGFNVIGISRNLHKLENLYKKKVIDEYVCAHNLKNINADIIFICLPVSETIPGLKKIYNFSRKDVIFCDIASIKNEIIIKAENFIKKNIQKKCFIGLHPMTGNEKSGFENAIPGLYDNAPCILVKSKYSDNKKINILKNVLIKIGMKIIETNAKKHDEMVSIVSHIPHLISYGYVTFFKQELNKNKILPEITAGSFRDITRISAAPTENWVDIIYENRKNIKIHMTKVINIYKSFINSLDNPDRLKKYLNYAKFNSKKNK